MRPGTPDSAASRLRGAGCWLVLAAALFVLNSAFSFHNVWPTLWVELRPELSVEAAGLVLVIALYRWLRGTPSRRFLAVLATLAIVMVVGRYMEVTAPALYGRAINLYWDARYVPDVAAMFAAQASFAQIAGVVLGIVAGTAFVWYVLYLAISTIAACLVWRPAGGVLRFAAAGLVAAYLLGYYASLPTLYWFSIPVSQTYARQTRFIIDAVAGPDASTLLSADDPLAVIDPDTLPDHDVIVTFIESYGAVAWDDPELAERLRAPRARFEAAIDEAARDVVSAWLVAPTFGGGSWLSHSSFMSGLDVNDAARYDALLTQNRTTLPKLFGNAGFRTLALMPGLKNEWPEGAFYGFDGIIGTGDLAYAGPGFGWWQIPDQYALAKLDATTLTAAGPPAFAFFPTISTHAPFRPTPPYQPDWARMLSSEPYSPAALAAIDGSVPSPSELKPAYGDALAYTYDYWGGYLGHVQERDFLLVLLGDHQPPATVSGQGARWDVPVHIVTNDAALRAKLMGHGFVEGLEPAPRPVGAIRELGLMLFD